MIVLNPGSDHDKLDYSDYKAAGVLVGDVSNNPAPLS